MNGSGDKRTLHRRDHVSSRGVFGVSEKSQDLCLVGSKRVLQTKRKFNESPFSRSSITTSLPPPPGSLPADHEVARTEGEAGPSEVSIRDSLLSSGRRPEEPDKKPW